MLAIASLLAVCTLAVLTLLMRWHLQQETDLSTALHRAHLAILSSLVVFYFVHLAATTERLKGRVSPFAFEVSAVVAMCATMAVVVLAAPARMCRLAQRDFKRELAMGYDSDSTPLLVISGMITVAHLGLPIRWFVMLPLALGGVLLHLIMLASGSSEPLFGQFLNLACLIFITATASLNKRLAETDERKAFREVLRERSLRCEAEYRLEQAKDQGRRGHPQDGQSDIHSTEGSLPTTAPSGAVFDALFHEDADVPSQLARIAAIGEQERWRIQDEEVTVSPVNKLGSGSFGNVVRGIFCGMHVAVKTPQAKLEDATALPDMCHEIRILRRLRHPRIVTTYGAILVPEQHRIALVLELVVGVTLRNFILDDSLVDSPSCLARYQIMIGISQALWYMHTRSPRVVHGDLKSSNVMVERVGDGAHPKLLDFGLSRVLTRNAQPLGGTRDWVAPEVSGGNGKAKCSADVYSFGLLIVFVAAGVPPPARPAGGDRRKQQHRACSGPLSSPTWPPECPFKGSCDAVVRACLQDDEAQRPPVREIRGKLLDLPREMDFGQDGEPFLEDVRLLPAELGREAPVTEPAPGSQLAALPESRLLAGSAAEEGRAPSRSGSSSPSPPRVPVRRPLPLQEETSAAAVEASLLVAISRWNFNYSPMRRFCCDMHAGLHFAQQAVLAAAAQPCNPRPLTRSWDQCKACGILGIDGPVCDMCGSEQDAASQPSSQP